MNIIPCTSKPNAQNQIAFYLEVDFFKTANGKFPLDRHLVKASTETFMVIFENSPAGVAHGNAVLFNHLLRRIMPMKSVKEMQKLGYDSLTPDTTITDSITLRKFLHQMMFAYICGSKEYATYKAFKNGKTQVPFIFAHASSVSEYITEFYTNGAELGFQFNPQPLEYLTSEQLEAYTEQSNMEQQLNFTHVIDTTNYKEKLLIAPELLGFAFSMNGVQDFIPMNIIKKCSFMQLVA